MNGTGPRAGAYTADLAAMFIYLNRTGYNGLFRLNSSGLFNVPRGRYKNPRICDEDNLRRVSSTLSELSVRIEHASFDTVVRSARAGDRGVAHSRYRRLRRTGMSRRRSTARRVSDNMRAYLHSTGKAVAYEDLYGWLTLFFGLRDGESVSS